MLPLVLAFVLPLGAASAMAGERHDFVAAERALAAGDRAGFERLAESLQDYPLYPYLRFADLTRDLAETPDAEIERFLLDYPRTQLAARLRRAYLRRLSDAGRWRDYARVYRPDQSTERRCLYLRALIEIGQEQAALSQIAPVWLSGRSQPAACDPVFEAGRRAGAITAELIWRRIRLASEAGSQGLVRYLGRELPKGERTWLRHLLDLTANPALTLDAERFRAQDAQRPWILAQGVSALARRSPPEAARALTRLRDWIREDPAAADRAQTAVGAALTRTGDPEGLVYWDGLRAGRDNIREQERRLRAALALESWDWLARWIARMPDTEVKRDRWLYWQARAQERLGRARLARGLYEQAARQRSLWGFLSADRLSRPYNLGHRPVPAEPWRIRRLLMTPTFQRIAELRRLGRETDMRRELNVLTAGMGTADLMAVAYVADVLKWHDQAIFALARTGYWDDLELRFPLRYQELVSEEAWQVGIEPEWIFALMRQESAFARTIASSAGAVGLMQLMPATAVEVATGLGQAAPARGELLDAALNIQLGTQYLAAMRDRFGHAALATAAYNAGPHRVRRWLPLVCTDADLWIARIPFAETRAYVERVLAYRIIYAARLGREQERIRDLLPPIPGMRFRQDGRLAERADGAS